MLLPGEPRDESRSRGPGIGRPGSVVIVAVRPGMQQRLPVQFSLHDVVDAGIRVGYLQDAEVQVLETVVAEVADQLAKTLVAAVPVGRVLAPAAPDASSPVALPT